MTKEMLLNYFEEMKEMIIPKDLLEKLSGYPKLEFNGKWLFGDEPMPISKGLLFSVSDDILEKEDSYIINRFVTALFEFVYPFSIGDEDYENPNRPQYDDFIRQLSIEATVKIITNTASIIECDTSYIDVEYWVSEQITRLLGITIDIKERVETFNKIYEAVRCHKTINLVGYDKIYVFRENVLEQLDELVNLKRIAIEPKFKIVESDDKEILEIRIMSDSSKSVLEEVISEWVTSTPRMTED